MKSVYIFGPILRMGLEPLLGQKYAHWGQKCADLVRTNIYFNVRIIYEIYYAELTLACAILKTQ